MTHRRSRMPRWPDEGGFTLVELLVVMIIIGVLAAIAVPVFLNQRGTARDTATKSDVANLGKELTTYFVDGVGPVSLDLAAVPGSIRVQDGGTYAATVRLSAGSRQPASGAATNLGDPDSWCVSLENPNGRTKTYRYAAQDGLEVGTC